MPKESEKTTELLPDQTALELGSLASLTREIIDREKRIDEKRKAAAQVVLETFNEILDQGKALLQIKAQMKHGQWTAWLAAYFTKSERTAQGYMAAYRASQQKQLLENLPLQQALFKISGLVPEVERQSAGEENIAIAPIIQRLNSIAEWVTKEGEHAVRDWPKPQRAELRKRLKPVVELYERLG